MLASAGWLSVALLPLKKRAKAGGKWGEEAEGPGVGVGGLRTTGGDRGPAAGVLCRLLLAVFWCLFIFCA